MKRTSILRRSEPKRTKPLRSRPRRRPAAEQPGRLEFTAFEPGACRCGCGRIDLFLDAHHVIPKQLIKAEGRDDLLWDTRNRLRLARICHQRHHSAFRKIRLEMVPESALAFAVDLFGEERAADFFRRAYDCEAL